MIDSDHIANIRQWQINYQKDRSEQNLHMLMLAFMQYGNTFFDLKNFAAASNAYQEAAEYAEKSEYLQTSIQIQRNLSDCYLKMGDACREQHESVASGTFYEKAMLLRETVMGQTGTLADRRVFCICCEKAAGTYDSQDRPDEARVCLEKSLTVRKQIAAETPKDYDRRMLATVYDCLGIHYERRNDRQAANDYYKEGLRLCQQLVTDSDTHQHREMLAYAYYNTATKTEERMDRKYYFQKACELFEQLHRERPTVEKYRKALEHIRIKNRLQSFLEE